jgi:hypothetical protein
MTALRGEQSFPKVSSQPKQNMLEGPSICNSFALVTGCEANNVRRKMETLMNDKAECAGS